MKLTSGKTISVLGVGVSATSYERVAAQVDAWVQARRAGSQQAFARCICVTSVQGVVTAHKDHSFRQILNGADIVTPDGMPIVWALRSLGEAGQQRVYGPTLMLEVCRHLAERSGRVFLYGSRSDVLRSLEDRLRDWFPGIQIAGSYSPPFRPLTHQEDQAEIARIRDANPDLIFVGI